MRHFSSFLISMAFVALVFSGCSREQTGADEVKIAAEWNGHFLTKEHFEREYTHFATYTHMRDRPEARDSYARLMLERLIIADYGRRNRLDTLPQVHDEIKRRREMAMRRFLLEQKVKPEVPEPTEEEIRQAFDRANTRLNLQQIYAPDEQAARDYYRRLQNGEPFERLAAESMRRAGMPADQQSGMMGWVTFDELDEAPEDVVFGLERHQISQPVPSLRGWHIFKLHDWERTIHLDDLSYDNMRDGLRHQVYQRRFDEASAHFIRDIVFSHELALDRLAFSALFEKIAPSLPTDGSPFEVQRYMRDLNLIMPEIDDSTPIAFVDRQPYTVGQFMRQLPDIPVYWVMNDFRHAVEIAIRDSILAARAMDIRADTARSVQFETGLAEYAGLYYATIGSVLDTLNFERLPGTYYEVWKDEQFIDYQITDFIQYEFTDSVTAADAISRFKQHGDWQKALRDTDGSLYDVRRLEQSTRDEYHLPVHRLPVSGDTTAHAGPLAGRDIIEGPFNRGKWIIIEAKNRTRFYHAFEDVEEDVRQLLSDRRAFVGHREALPEGFSRDDIIVYQDVLDEALPYYYDMAF